MNKEESKQEDKLCHYSGLSSPLVYAEEYKQEYEYAGECNGNNGNGCFMDSPGHDCGCFTKVPKEEAKPHSFCETPEEKCTMNYCDENGCQNRKRELVEPKEPERGITITHVGKQETKMIECYFIPNNNTSSATICGNCGKEKFLHTIGSGIKAYESVIIPKEEPLQETDDFYIKKQKELRKKLFNLIDELEHEKLQEEPKQETLEQEHCNNCGKTLREQMKGCNEITCYRQFLSKQEPNLSSLELKLDEVLSKETEESLTTWLDEKRSKQETIEEFIFKVPFDYNIKPKEVIDMCMKEQENIILTWRLGYFIDMINSLPDDTEKNRILKSVFNNREGELLLESYKSMKLHYEK